MLNIAGFQLHAYGLLIGLAIWVGYFLVEQKAKRLGWSTKFLEGSFWWVMLGGILGARLYHVVSDFNLYRDNLWNAFKIWEGGLSVIGAVIGGALALFLLSRSQRPDHSLLSYLDLAVFGLPVAQAVGRLANYFNQELYGLPSSLPWALYIQPAKRLAGWEDATHFHPLFAYEMSAMVLFGTGVWWIAHRFSHNTWAKVGQGWYFLSYVAYYCMIRIVLDFIRLDKHVTAIWGLGSNQIMLLIVLSLVLVTGLVRVRKRI